MPLPLANDLLTIFNVDEFAVTITYRRVNAKGDSTIRAIFDNETVPFDGGGFSVIHQEQPRVTCRTADVPSISYEDQMVISGTVYTVREWMHDGTGVTVVHLEKQ